MAAESFYTDVDFTGSETIEGGPLSLGVVCTVPAGTFLGIRWRYPAVAPSGSVPVRIYPGAGGAALATKAAFDTTTLDVWNVATFASPLSVSAGTYRPTIVTPGRYTFISGFFSGGTVTRGNLTFGTSRFDTGDIYPTQSSPASYTVDVLFEATSAATIIDLGRITETTTMRALAAVKTAALGRIVTRDTMRALTLVKTIALGRITETTTMRGLTVNQPTAADMDITVGPPRTAWTLGQPRTSWTIGRPR